MPLGSSLVNKLESLRSDTGSTVKSKLEASGWTASEVNSIQDILDRSSHNNNVTEAHITGIETEVTTEARAEMLPIITKFRTEEKKKESGEIKDAYTVFNAKNSLSIPEPIFSGAKVTSPIDIQAADYSTKEDYPNTSGFIDSVKNWWKTNKTKKHSELVLASGNHIKTDKDGNVTMYVKGSFKHIIEGDYSLQINGNHDLIIGGNTYRKVGGNLEDSTGGTYTHGAGGNYTVTAPKIDLN